MIEHVSDTAFWVAWFRAQESELFQDPLAARLAGDRGREIAVAMNPAQALAFAFAMTMRTVAIDRLIGKAIALGAQTVINLGAGLDTRPYRMPLPNSLRWIEVDLPQVIDYKSRLLASERSACRVERIPADLTRDAIPDASRAVVLTEGLVGYLTAEQASKLSRDLFAAPGINYWIQDYRRGRLNRRAEAKLGAPLRFDVLEPLEYFGRDGWVLRENLGILDVADSVRRRVPLSFPWNAVRAVFPRFVRRKGNETYGYAMLGRQ